MASNDMKKTLNDLENSLKKLKIHEKNLNKIVKNLSKAEKKFSSVSDFKVDKKSYKYPIEVLNYKEVKEGSDNLFFGGSDDDERISWKKQKKLDSEKFMTKKTEREFRLLAYMSGISPDTNLSDIERVVIKKKNTGETYFLFESKRYHIETEYDFNTKTLINKFIGTIKKEGEDVSGGGLNILTRQIANLKAFGKIKKIEGEFLRRGNSTGYYAYLRYGFIPDRVAQSTYSDLINEYNELYPNGKVSKIEDFLKTETGRSFWKEKGGDWDGHFDLSDNSYSMKVLEDYVKNKIDKDLFNLTFK
jgi:hypothetical protein